MEALGRRPSERCSHPEGHTRQPDNRDYGGNSPQCGFDEPSYVTWQTDYVCWTHRHWQICLHIGMSTICLMFCSFWDIFAPFISHRISAKEAKKAKKKKVSVLPLTTIMYL